MQTDETGQTPTDTTQQPAADDAKQTPTDSTQQAPADDATGGAGGSWKDALRVPGEDGPIRNPQD